MSNTCNCFFNAFYLFPRLSVSEVVVKHEIFCVAFIYEANKQLFFANCCHVYVEYKENFRTYLFQLYNLSYKG